MSATDTQEDQLRWVFFYGAHPLWAFLRDTIDIDISEVCPYVAKEPPVLKTQHGDLVARVVDLPFSEKLPEASNLDVCFLVNSINTVFNTLKSGIERDGVNLLGAFEFHLDEFNTLRLQDSESGVLLAERGIAIVRK